MALSIIRMFKDVANAIKGLPKYTKISKKVYTTMSTNMIDLHSISVPANSYVALTATAIWGNCKPTAVVIAVSGDDNSNLYSEGYAGYQNATTTVTFFSASGCTVTVKAKYTSAQRNRAIISGFILTFGGGYCVTWLGGGLRAKLKTVLARCSRFCKNIKTTVSAKQNKKWTKIAESSGTISYNADKYNELLLITYFGGVRIKTFIPVITLTTQCANAFCRDVQFRNLCEYKQNNHFGIQTTNWLHSRTNPLRQITPRGGVAMLSMLGALKDIANRFGNISNWIYVFHRTLDCLCCRIDVCM